MRRITFGVIIWLGIGAASAQTLYQCASRAGNSYQQVPCAASARLVRSWETQPDPAPTAEALAARAQKAAQDRAESAFLSHTAGTDRWPSSVGSRSAGRSRRQRGADHVDATVKPGRVRVPRSLRRIRSGVIAQGW